MFCFEIFRQIGEGYEHYCQDHLSSLCNTDVRVNEISITVHAPLKPEVCIFFALFFTVVYILELLVLQKIYVLLS